VKLGRKCFLRALPGKLAPDTRAPIAIARAWADRIASLEGEIRLDVVYGGVIVVFDLTQLEEAKAVLVDLLSFINNNHRGRGAPTFHSISARNPREDQ